MRKRALRGCLVALAGLLITGCCSGAHCPERASGGDWPRTKAKWAKKYGKVINGQVSYPKLDRSDWRYVVLPGSGKLTAEMHWDDGTARLEMSVWDAMGIRLMECQDWRMPGSRCAVAVENPGRYYILIRAKGEDDASTYALRIFFKPEGKAAECDPCESVGEKKCLGDEGFQVCQKQSAKCIGWSKTITCGGGKVCQDGLCAMPTVSKPPPPRTGCRNGARRCSGRGTYMVCAHRKGKGRWSKPIVCPGSQVCSSGKCTAGAAPKPAPKKGCVTGKIISLYLDKGKPILHIELPAGHSVTPRSGGYVLQGSTKKKLSNGGFKVKKVSGNYCVAVTTLKVVGQNRKVCITPN